ncbi:MAG TPA: hypothetical protein VH396_02635 [Chitinophagaceae bacterium]
MEEFKHLDEEDKLKAENDFLKMKIMLEHGADFHKADNENNLTPEIENEFLRNIIEFEKQFEAHKTITVFEKIGKPQHFKPHNEIPDKEIDDAWRKLADYMAQYGVDLSVCSPKVTTRELYRFATEELFKHATEDINIPGMMSGFIYDEFYPDHEYDNTRAAVDDCIKRIFEKEPLEWMHHFKDENIRLNNHYPLSKEELQIIVNRFKDSYDEIELINSPDTSCEIADKLCNVKGSYSANGKIANETILLKGNWLVQFELNEEYGYWYIVNVQIEGIKF